MVNINFVPDDYIQNNESRRTNVLYLVLFAVVMAGLGGSFVTIKLRQRALDTKEVLVNKRLTDTQVAIKQFEHLQQRRKEMMKTALTTAGLLEIVPRSVLLAALTNNLPSGVSLLELRILQNEPKKIRTTTSTNKYKKIQGGSADSADTVSRERLLETNITIEGVAPTDRQVAAYIQSLGGSTLLENVALVESKEHNIDDTAFRRFKLTAVLTKNAQLTKEDIEKIRAKGEHLTRVF